MQTSEEEWTISSIREKDLSEKEYGLWTHDRDKNTVWILYGLQTE